MLLGCATVELWREVRQDCGATVTVVEGGRDTVEEYCGSTEW